MLKANHLFGLLYTCRYAYLHIYVCMGLFSCQSPEIVNQKMPNYFDMKALITNQVVKLNSSKPIFSKKAVLNGTTSKVEVDQINWEKEMKIFENLDINKPIFRGMYELQSTTTAGTIIDYYAKIKNSKSQISHISVEYSKSKKLKSIEAVQLVSNPVFNSENNYLMQFDTTTQQLNFYQLVGWQGFSFGKKDSFLIQAKIILAKPK